MAIDFMKVFKGLNFAGQASAPSSPANGDVYYDTTLQKLRCYENGAWVNLSDSDGTVVLALGSNSAPSLSFTGDSNTGIFSPGADQLAFTMGGVTAASFSAAGDFTLSRSSASLVTAIVRNTDAASGAADASITIDADSATADSYLSVIGGTSVFALGKKGGDDKFNFVTNSSNLDGGNIVIQLDASALTVALGEIASTATHLIHGDLQINGGTGVGGNLYHYVNDTGGAGQAIVHRLRGNNTTAGSGNAQVGILYQQGSTSSNRTIARMDALSSDPTPSSSGGSIRFQTSTTAGSLTTALTINESQQSLFAAGTSSLPSISFSAQPGMGLYRVGTDHLRFVGQDATQFSIWNSGANDDSILRLENNGSSTGDQFIFFLESGVTASQWSMGRDDSDSGAFKVSQAAALGTNDFFKLATTGRYDLRSAAGQDFVIFGETGNTSGTARIYASLASGNTTGDAYYVAQISGGVKWSSGLDNSDSDSFKISNGDGVGVADAISITNSTLNVSVVAGNLAVSTAGKGLQIKEGSNAKMGVATLVAGTVTVNTTAVTANSRIFLTHQNNSGTPGFVSVTAKTASTSFTITSASATDTSDIAWIIVEPA